MMKISVSKMFSKLLILLFTFVITVFSDTNTTDKHKYLADKQPEPTEVKFLCPDVKDGYKTRVFSVNYWSGTTTCLVFDNLTNDVLDKVSYTNSLVFKNNQNTLNAIKKNLPSSTQSDRSIERFKKLENIKENYINTYKSGSKQFLDVPSYMIAGLTLDSGRIDIESTILNNSVQLNNDYTLYPNSYTDFDLKNNQIGTLGILGELWDRVREKFPSYKETNEVEKQEYERLRDDESKIVSTTKDMLTNIIIFIVHFFQKYNPTLLEIKAYLLFTIIPITSLFLISSKITKKISGIRDTDDIVEKIFMAVVTLFVFYLTSNTIKVNGNDEEKISQVNYHGLYRQILQSGTDFANKVSYSALDAYMLYKLKDVGIVSQQTESGLLVQKAMLDKEKTFLEGTLKNACFDTYNTEKTRQDVAMLTGLNLPFPPDETVKMENNALGNRGLNWYHSSNLTNPNINPSVAISGCANLYKELKEKEARLKDVLENIYLIKETQKDNVTNEKLELLAKTQYRNFGELGWMAMPMLASMDSAVKELELVSNFAKELKRKELSEDRNNANAESSKEITSEIDSELLKNLPYLMIPFTSTIKQELQTALHVPLISNVFPQLGQGVAFWASVSITKFFIGMLPSVVILASSLLIIGFWLISILVYYIVTPFLIAFALATNQTEVIKKYLTTGVVLAFKPLMIVISIIIAMFAIDFLTNLNALLLDWNYDNIKLLFSKVDLDLVYLYMLKEFLHIVNTIVIAVFAFYLIFNGSDLILNMFGVKDINIDIQSDVGDKLDSKSSKYSSI